MIHAPQRELASGWIVGDGATRAYGTTPAREPGGETHPLVASQTLPAPPGAPMPFHHNLLCEDLVGALKLGNEGHHARSRGPFMVVGLPSRNPRARRWRARARR